MKNIVVPLCFVLYFLGQAKGQIVFGCAKDECSRQPTSCPDLQCNNGRIVKNATRCGCCHVCIRPLEEGSKCVPTETARIPRFECGPGLQCHPTEQICLPGTTDCTKDLARLTTLLAGQELSTGQPMPRCDQFGYYEPRQCKKGMICYCVDRAGNRIFGTAPYTQEENVNCLCSRDLTEMKEAGSFRGDEVQFLRCDQYGNYDEVQCTDSDCYCTKDGEQMALPIANKNWLIKNLPCYNPRHHGESFKTPCLLERENILNQIKNASDHGWTMVSLEPPECDPDGSYAPKQCQGDKCFCVNKQGERYFKVTSGNWKTLYEVARYSQEAEEMLCNCERDKAIFKEMLHDKSVDVFNGYKCWTNGNYLPTQCSNNVCYCVDRNGFQTNDKAVITVDIKDLSCYDESYKDILEILD